MASLSGRIRHLRVTRRISSERIRRLVRFGLVGLSGVAVNAGVAWLAHELLFTEQPVRLRQNLAVGLGIIVSIFTNFVLNDVWTWGDRTKGRRIRWFVRLAKYYVAAAIGAAVQAGMFNIAIVVVGDDLFLVANLTGIAVGTVFNFVLMHFWSFKSEPTESPHE